MNENRSDTVNELGQPVGWPALIQAAEMPERTAMHGQYCDLEPLDLQAHGADLFKAFSAAQDDGDWTYLSYGPFQTQHEFTEVFARFEQTNDPMFFTVIDRTSRLAVGLASYLRVDLRGAVIEVGHIHFSRSLQKRPAATEAMYLMMQRAFASGFRRYEWKCDALNSPSRVAAQRLGFSYEGTFRQATHYKGRNRDTAWFSILDNEWPSLQAEFVRWLDSTNFSATGVQKSQLMTLTLR